MGFQVTVKVRDANKVKNLQALAQQIANAIEAFTKQRTIVNVKDFSNGRR